MTKRKVLLQTDYLTGKVLNIDEYSGDGRGTPFYVADINILQAASSRDKDLYFINGRLEERDIVNDFHSKLTVLSERLSQLRKDDRAAFYNYASGNDINTARETIFEISEKIKIVKQEMLSLQDEHTAAIRSRINSEMQKAEFKYYCSICLIVKDDTEYLTEWLDWHINQGVEHFYIYDHESALPVSEFVKTLSRSTREKITVIDFSGEHEFAQHDAYNDCLCRFKNESRWIGYIDSDEMVRVREEKTLPEFLAEFEEAAGIFIGWIMYNANGRVKKSDEPLRERFKTVTSYDGQNGVGKVFVQPIMMRQMLTHNGYTVPSFSVVDENHEEIEEGSAYKCGLTHERVCVDHYYTKSYEEWLIKMSRGTCDPYFCRKYDEFFKYNPDMEYCREKQFPTQKYEGNKEVKFN